MQPTFGWCARCDAQLTASDYCQRCGYQGDLDRIPKPTPGPSEEPNPYRQGPNVLDSAWDAVAWIGVAGAIASLVVLIYEAMRS